jgi:sulfite exporter TauE/SafE
MSAIHFIPIPAFASIGEALLLGLTTGPVCLASCGPAVVPWMLAQPSSVRSQSKQLLLFLVARLAGYLLFATGVWVLGTTMMRAFAAHTWTMGAIQVFLAASLLVFAAGWPRLRRHEKQNAELVHIGKPIRQKRSGALTLGFLTGINFCPPFLVASVRGAQLLTLPATLIFFLSFFAGTAVWFTPYFFLGLVRRTQTCVLVARITAVLLACWYGISGISILIARLIHG